MPSDGFLKVTNALHRGVIKITGGRVGYSAGKMPAFELVTVGRTSGKERSVMLTAPHVDGETLVVVASRGGDDHHPAWYLNLVANPDVTVKMRGETKRMRARVATDQERDELWPSITSTYGGYANYQKKTDRKIPVVFLEPAPS